MNTKKSLSILAAVVLLMGQVTPVLALDVPTAPPAPTAPALPTDPGGVPTPPPTPAPPASTPTPPPMPTKPPTPHASATPAATSTPEDEAPSTPAPTATGTTGQTINGGAGGTVETGDATTTAAIVNTGNNNAATVEPSGTAGGASIVENGADSGSTIQESHTDSVVTSQANTATINNSMQGASVTGDNSVSYSTGGDSKIKTGDANTTGTIINNVNTNLAGVTVSEFNIVDDHVGNVILDLSAGCISGCQSLPGSHVVANGANSQNGVLVNDLTQSQTFQNNDADITNSMVLAADTGDNLTSYNTGGDSSIQTGDANVAANILNFANNNIAGNVYYTVVNIFGDLIGNIILPESELAGSQNTNQIAANGANSTNALQSTQTFNQETNQTNAATIENNLVFDANAGRNGSSYNTGGDSTIQTGDTTVEAQVTNVANANLDGGNWFLVIVNEAGNWVGRIMGLPGVDGTAAANFDVAVDQNGNVIAGNGAGSSNAINQSSASSNEINQTNTADIKNNVNLSANTGNNKASYNTNGNSTIQTGDATIIANIVNFVNTNITGGAKLFVTVINVFGSWKGNFGDTTPVADTSSPSQPSTNTPSNNSTQSSSSGSSSSTNSSASAPTPRAVVLGLVRKSAKAVLASATPQTPQEGQVLGTQTEVSGNAPTTINLAWGLPILVLLGGVYLLRRKFA